MKIVYIARSKIPSTSANSIAVMKMCEAFCKNGYDVYLLIFEYDSKYHINEDPFEFYGIKNSFKILKLPPRNKKKTLYKDHIKLVHTYIRSLNPDFLYTRDNCYTYLLHDIGLPLAIELHTEVYQELDKFYGLIQSPNLRKIIVINEFLKSYYIKHYNINSEDIIVAHSASDINNIKEKIQLPGKNNLKVGYIGHLYPGKGMEIIAKLIESCSWADFHIVGGTNEDINIWDRKLAGFKNSFMHGFIRNSEIKKYINSMDILLAPYQKNIDCAGGARLLSDWISPLKIFDYMSAGKAIIASNLSSIREVLKNDSTAILCDHDNLQEWINNIKRLDENQSLIYKLGESAKNDFINRYTWHIRAKKILNSIMI